METRLKSLWSVKEKDLTDFDPRYSWDGGKYAYYKHIYYFTDGVSCFKLEKHTTSSAFEYTSSGNFCRETTCVPVVGSDIELWFTIQYDPYDDIDALDIMNLVSECSFREALLAKSKTFNRNGSIEVASISRDEALGRIKMLKALGINALNGYKKAVAF